MKDKRIIFTARQDVAEFYDYNYGEEEFNQDKERFQLDDLTFDELLRVMEDRDFDHTITVTTQHPNRPSSSYTTSTYDFFLELIRESALDNGPIDTEYNEWEENIDLENSADFN